MVVTRDVRPLPDAEWMSIPHVVKRGHVWATCEAKRRASVWDGAPFGKQGQPLYGRYWCVVGPDGRGWLPGDEVPR